MASIRRLARTLAGCRRSLAPSKTLASLNRPSPRFHGVYSPSPRFQYLLGGRTFQHHRYSEESEHFPPRWISQLCLPAMLSALLGFRVIDVTYADTDETSAKTPLPAQSSPTLSHSELVEIAMNERVRVEKLCKSKGTQYGFYPRFSVAVKGQKVTIKFQIPPTCEIPLIIADLVSRLGAKIDDDASGSDMMLQAWNSGVAWQLTLGYHGKQDRNGETPEQGKDIDTMNSDLCILLSRPLVGSNNAEIEFMKPGSLNSEELEALVSVMQIVGQQKTSEGKLRGDIAQTHDKTVASLEDMGVKIFGLNDNKLDDAKSDISWENIAGYDQQKREIEDTILLALRSPEVYDEIARETRSKFETNRPRAVLFEGPPGTGKTSCARVIANQAGVPLLYVPLEIIVSKYYGQSERLLGKVFSLANELPNGAIIFLDEVDSFVASRDGEIHEATRRLLSVILRQIDGFEQEKKVVVVAATNRKQDLDPALLSRFDSMIIFGLPDHQTRQEIAAQYAKHLTKTELIEFANATEHMSGRDIKDVCQQAERHWAAKIIRGQSNGKEEHQGLAPPLQEYIESAMYRQQSLIDAAANEWQPFAPRRNHQFDFL